MVDFKPTLTQLIVAAIETGEFIDSQGRVWVRDGPDVVDEHWDGPFWYCGNECIASWELTKKIMAVAFKDSSLEKYMAGQGKTKEQFADEALERLTEWVNGTA